MRTTYLLLVALYVSACGAPQDEEKGNNGGDHIPTGETFNIASLPSGTTVQSPVAAKEYKAPFLRSYLHIAERYEICVARDEMKGDEVAAVQARLSNRDGALPKQGLESVVNDALATLKQFKPDSQRFSSRVAIDVVVGSTETSCNLMIFRAAADAFPFNDPKVKDKRTQLFYTGQLQDGEGNRNRRPVAYVAKELDLDATTIAMQYVVAAYLGLAESTSTHSYLSSKLDPAEPSAAFLVEGGPDTMILYGFALAYRDVLRPRDLETYHYYNDTLGFAQPATDPLLVIPAGAAAPAFRATPGHRDLMGVRPLSAPLAVCMTSDTPQAPTRETFASALDVFSIAKEGSIANLLHAKLDTFTPQVTLAEQGCGLLVAFRDSSQYPFATQSANGLYAHEGHVQDAAGTKSPLPIVYINMSNLLAERDAEASNAKKWFGYVLHHESAHFLGLKHSRSSNSLLSPAGYNAAFDPADDEMFRSWAAEAQKPL